ncbi:LuxR C-terminal-related transcriptional regulator [Flavobacterium sp.]|uniref:LuxR C-terminal-related transcriptional regulator n=1 Tax=Flavobacterium sp. TaxID=239 RepID=UPI002610FAE2|nr:LuxR C-terminal-related transcriptional regulator [Flavobacterium sp.]
MSKKTSLSAITEVQNIWKVISTENKSKKVLAFDLDVHKKLLNVFHVGEFYYIILDVYDGEFIYVSPTAEEVIGIKPGDLTIGVLLEKIHPEDLPYFMNFEQAMSDFFKTLPAEKVTRYKSRYDYRIQKSNGDYIRILQQVIVLEHDQDGSLLKSLCVHTDISHIKTAGKPLLSIIGIDGEPSYINVDVAQKFVVSSFLSKREKQIINLLIEGKVSKEIALTLGLTLLTIETYRKKLLQKTASKSIAQMIAKAIREGWV